MPNKETATQAFDPSVSRAQSLGGFLRLAKQVLGKARGMRSVMLSCSQYYADEAGDAVHDSVNVAQHGTGEGKSGKSIDYDLRWKHMPWDDNSAAVYAFAPMCNEEGFTEDEVDDVDEDADYFEGGSVTSSLVSVELLADKTLRATWLGALHRPWLDFPGAMKNREDFVDNFALAPEPSVPPLVGKESELYDQVLADPTNVATREVLGDVWLARNDVRGEFTALSMQPKLADKLRERAAAIVLDHGRSWLGPLAHMIPYSGALFGPGPFVKKAIVYAEANAWKKFGTAAEWATVEELTFANDSVRKVTKAMKNLRIVGPLATKELDAFDSGTWRVTELDVEVDAKTLKKLASLKLPLTRLRLRSADPVDLSTLAKASWFGKLEHVELWLPGTVVEPAKAIDAAFKLLVKGTKCRVSVGVLKDRQRSGWMLSGTVKAKELVLFKPDARRDLGEALAKATKLKLPTSWTPPADDWLTFGLGVSLATKG